MTLFLSSSKLIGQNLDLKWKHTLKWPYKIQSPIGVDSENDLRLETIPSIPSSLALVANDLCLFPSPLTHKLKLPFSVRASGSSKKPTNNQHSRFRALFFPIPRIVFWWKFRETTPQSTGNLSGWVGGPIPSPIRETACHGCRTRGKNKDFHLPSNTTSKKKGCLLWRVLEGVFVFDG